MTPLRTIILEAIRLEDDFNTHWSERQSLAYALNSFLSSKSKEIQKIGFLHACENWFRGIGLHIPYWDSEIKELGHDPDTYWTELAKCFLNETLKLETPHD
tara:strand:+ start:466 stop:768 length:303 start_codon:yes stop_codon:yes gene_type:complete